MNMPLCKMCGLPIPYNSTHAKRRICSTCRNSIRGDPSGIKGFDFISENARGI